MIVRAFVLASFIKAKAGNGERVGIMLPASAAAVLSVARGAHGRE